jgi:AraC family transcriptional regulator
MGFSPSRYQIDLRMNEARRLLRETNESIVNIALDVGYSNPSHFAKLFRRENGLTPSKYRRER